MIAKTMKQSTLYICVLILMLLELVLSCYPFDFQSFNEYQLVLVVLNTIVMGIAYIGVIAIVDIFLKQDKYEYINLLGVSILTLLFSCLMFNDIELPVNGNVESLSMVQLVIYQIGSLIKMYIPILIVICYENSKSQIDTNILNTYRKPIGYIVICTIVATVLKDYRLLIGIIGFSLITVMLISIIPKNKPSSIA